MKLYSKFGKWIDYGKFSLKGAWSGLLDPFQNFKHFNISAMDKATLFKFDKWVDFGKSHPRGKKFLPQNGVVWVT